MNPISRSSAWWYMVAEILLSRVAAHHWVIPNGSLTAGVVPPYSGT